ncbi:MAG: FG-GAP repeat domain-containing protein [Acidiferrobacterales bacterium]
MQLYFSKWARALAILVLGFTGNAFAKYDVVVDFGGIGLWARMNDATWLKLNNASPDQFVVGDINGNGKDDVIAVYPGGIFVKRDLGGWTQLHNFTPETMATGDLDGNGKDDVVIDFGGIGLWARMNDTSWLKLNNASPAELVVGDINGNGKDDVIAVFPGGIFVKRDLGGWAQLHNFTPEAMTVGDLDGSGADDVLIDFGAIGLWARMNDSSWVKLHNTSPLFIAAGDLNGNGADDVLATFGGGIGGLWQKLDLGGWNKINNNAPEDIEIADVDGTGQEDIIGDFGSTLGGVFVKRNQGAWLKLHNTSPDSIAAGDLDGDGLGTSATIRGTFDEGMVIAVDASGSIIATDETSGRVRDAFLYGSTTPTAFTFALNSLPVNENIRVYFINEGVIASMYFDATGDFTVDTNVLSLAPQADISVGQVYVDMYFARAFPASSPVLTANASAGPVNPVVPIGITQPATTGLTIPQLITKGLNALDFGWVTGARTYFSAANTLAGNSTSPDADGARFFYAITRVAALGFDTLPDGNAADMNRLSDVLDRFGVANDEKRASPSALVLPLALPANSPTGNEIRDFIYNISTAEIQSAISTLDQISPSFTRIWNEPALNEVVESDYGDVLFYKASFKAMLSSVAIQKAYNLDADIDATMNTNRDVDPLNDTTTEDFLANGSNASFLTLADTARLTEAKNKLLAALDDSLAAIVAIEAETDSQLDDLITLDTYAAAGAATAKDYISDTRNSIQGTGNRFDRNDLDVTNDLVLQLDRFFGVGVDFRSSNLLPGFIGNDVSGLFPDPTFNGVVLTPDLNEDIFPADGIPDVVQ